MTEGDAEPGQHEAQRPERQEPYAFIVVMAGVLAAVAGTLALLAFSRFIAAAALLFAAAIGMAVGWHMAWRSKNRMAALWFHRVTSILVIFALLAAGFYAIHRWQFGGKPAPLGNVTRAPPQLSFNLPDPASVPWCNTFLINVKGSMPAGYKIVVFDASVDRNGKVTSYYNYDGPPTKVPRTFGEWQIKPVFISDEFGLNSNGKPVINAGYPAAVFARLVTDNVANMLDDVHTPVIKIGRKKLHPGWLLTNLPGALSATHHDVTRNHDLGRCAPSGG